MSKTLKNRGGGPVDWLRTQFGLDRSYATHRASSGTRTRRQEKLKKLYDFSTRPRSRSSRSGSKKKEIKK